MTPLPHDRFSLYLIFEYFSKICRENPSLIQIWQEQRVLARRRCTFMTIYHWIILRMKNVYDKSCRENQNTHFMLNISPKYSYSTINKMHLFLRLLILVKCSTCFGPSFHQSSGAQNSTYGNRHMSNSCCLTYACCCMCSFELLMTDGKTKIWRAFDKNK